MSLETDKIKVTILIAVEEGNLRTVRDLRACSKSTIKNKLTKIEKHTALVVEELKKLAAMYAKK
jgi:hypothetical protein